MKRALQYLWRTNDVVITYGGTSGSRTKLSAWVDADFGTCSDTRRSVSGGAVMLGGGCDRLVLDGAEGDRGRVIRIRVCGAGRSCKGAPFPSTGEALLDAADRRQYYNQGR